MPLGLENNLKILNECDDNSTDTTATDINLAMVKTDSEINYQKLKTTF